jgi:hypothetical protein
MAIEELAKPAGSWCSRCAPGHGCRNYRDRPRECRDFSCLWLVDARFGSHWKPDRSKIVLTTSPDGLEARCDPGFPLAWRSEPFRTELRNLAKSGEAHDVSVLIIVGSRMTLVGPEQEFELGVVKTDERILREFEGTRIVGASIVKARDLGK